MTIFLSLSASQFSCNIAALSPLSSETLAHGRIVDGQLLGVTRNRHAKQIGLAGQTAMGCLIDRALPGSQDGISPPGQCTFQ
jgi:hypothetical protein